MSIFLAAVFASATVGTLCQNEQFGEAMATASAGLEEIASELHVSEDQAGAVLLSWRLEACALLEGDPQLFPSTMAAIEGECFSHSHLIDMSAEERFLSLEKVAKNRSPDIIALAWAERDLSSGYILHRVLVTDGAFSADYTFQGYGRKGAHEPTCVVSASKWKF